MIDHPLPEKVRPQKMAEQGQCLEGTFSLSLFTRAQEFLAEKHGDVHMKVEGVLDEEGRVLLQGTLSASPAMLCQRCFTSLTVPVETRFSLVMVKNDAAAKALPTSYEPWVLEGDMLSLLALAEEELLLALPHHMLHEPDACKVPAFPEVGDSSRENPFHVLANLKTH